METLAKIGNKLRVLRQAKGFSQENVANLLNVSPATYARMERGETDFRVTKLEEIADLLDVQITDLVSNEKGIILFKDTQNTDCVVGNAGYATIEMPKEDELSRLKEDVTTLKEQMKEILSYMKGK